MSSPGLLPLTTSMMTGISTRMMGRPVNVKAHPTAVFDPINNLVTYATSKLHT